LSPEGRSRLEVFTGELRHLTRLAATTRLSSLVRSLLHQSGIFAELDASNDPSAPTIRQHVCRFIEIAHEFEIVQGRSESQLRAFIEYLTFLFESGDDKEEDEIRPTSDDTVKIMTIHKAKGLEFDCVFVPGLVAGKFPNERPQRSSGDAYAVPSALLLKSVAEGEPGSDQLAQQEAEERRLCYVAFTRAVHHLVLSRAHYYTTNVNPKSPSIFWSEALVTEIPRLELEEACPTSNPRAEVEEKDYSPKPPQPFPLELIQNPETVRRYAEAQLPQEEFEEFEAKSAEMRNVIAAVVRLEEQGKTQSHRIEPPTVHTASSWSTAGQVCDCLVGQS
jgi:DNA helicase II / ATP-dependent DNA helicase PcrA